MHLYRQHPLKRLQSSSRGLVSAAGRRLVPSRSCCRAHPSLYETELSVVNALSDAQLQQAMRKLGEDAECYAGRAELLHALARRRLLEKAKIVRLPLRYTTTGMRRASRRYLTVPVDAGGDVGFMDFLLEAGTYSALITPAFRTRLGLSPLDGTAARTLNSRGPTLRQRVELGEMWLGTQMLPPLQAYVSQLPVARHRDVAGLLGVKVLRRFELDINITASSLALHPAGHAAAGLLDTTGLVRVPCKYTKTGLVCLPVSLNGRPLLGILDLSAAVSILNWEAAALLGMQCDHAAPAPPTANKHQQQQPMSESEVGSSSAGQPSSQGAGTIDGTGSGGSINSSSGGGGSNGSTDGASKSGNPHRWRKRLQQLSNASEDNDRYLGCYGSIEIEADVPPLHRPHLHHATSPSSSSPWRLPHQSMPSVSVGPKATHHKRSSDVSPSTSRSGSPRGSSDRHGCDASSTWSSRSRLGGIVQVQRLRAADLTLRLGSDAGGSGVCVTPPSRVAVAHLRGLKQLGLGSCPAIIVGSDLWARQRTVLCLKSGALYLPSEQG